MRELVYDIIENGKVIETTPILSKAKASGKSGFMTRLILTAPSARSQLSGWQLIPIIWDRSQSCRHTPRRFEIESAWRAHVRLGAFLIILRLSHICQEQNCTKIMPAPARNLCLTAKELYDIV